MKLLLQARPRSGRMTRAVLAIALSAGAACDPPAEDRTAADSAASTTDSSSVPAPELAGTAWRLVRFEGGDGAVLAPDDRSSYTIAFGTDGRVNARIDCNQGSSTWTSSAPSHLEFGPLTSTKVACPPGSLHDQIVRQWPYVRSYVMRDGHLFLSLMADGGIYEYEPATSQGTAGDSGRA